jgi:putative membrane protein
VGFEYLGIHTCFPYGCFVYGDMLGAKLRDTVPWTIFVGWTPLIIGIYAIMRKYIQHSWLIVLIGAALLTLVDMVLDPGAVLLGFWMFDAGGWYYHVPWSNFFGWFLSGLVGMGVAHMLLRRTNITIQRTYSAALTLSFFTGIAVFSGMRIPAVL